MSPAVRSKNPLVVSLLFAVGLSASSLPAWCADDAPKLVSKGDEAKAEAVFKKGHRAFDKQNVRKAEEFYRKAVDINPTEPRYHRQLCLLLVAMQRGQEAEREALIALNLDPDDWRTMIVLGNIFNREKRYEEELHIYRKACKVIPEKEKATRDKLREHVRRGELAMKKDADREKRKRELEEAEFKNRY